MRIVMLLVLTLTLLSSSGAAAQLPVMEFTAYPGFSGGASVAFCDLDRDGSPEIVTGAGPGGGPHVRVLDLVGRSRAEFFAYPATFSGGVLVACGPSAGTIVTAPGLQAGSLPIRIWTPTLAAATAIPYLIGLDGSFIYDGTNCPFPAPYCDTFVPGLPFPPEMPGPPPEVRPCSQRITETTLVGTDGSRIYSGTNCPIPGGACATVVVGCPFPGTNPVPISP